MRLHIASIVVALCLGVHCIAQDPIPDPVPNAAGGLFDDFDRKFALVMERLDKQEQIESQRHKELLEAIKQANLPQGPITDAITDRLDKIAEQFSSDSKANQQAMEGLFDRWRNNDEERFSRIKALIENIKPGDGDSRLLPKLNDMWTGMKALNEKSDLVLEGTGPIREALGLLTTLVYALIALSGMVLIIYVVQVLRSIFAPRLL